MSKHNDTLAVDDPEPTEAQVVAYLRRHPDFLSRQPDLLARLSPPRRQWSGKGGAKVVDLQHAMLERLRGEIDRLHQIKGEILATSRGNLQTQMRIHASVLSMLSAQSLAELIETVTTDLAVLLDVDVIALGVEAGPVATPIEGIKLLPRGLVEELMGASHRVLLRERVSGDKRVYGAAAGLVQSDALVRPEAVEEGEGPPFLLAFGSRDPDHFHPGQGTELISFLGIVLWHCMGAWLEREG